MKWYAAHLVFYFKLKEDNQATFPVSENIVLISARTEDEAFAKADERARDELLGNDESLRWGGQPAEMIYAGVRKMTTCQFEEERPGDGTEVSYIEMELASEAAIRKFVDGLPVSVMITDAIPEVSFVAVNGIDQNAVVPGRQT